MVHPENYYLIRCFLQDSMHFFHFKQMAQDTFPPINPCKEDVQIMTMTRTLARK